MDPGSRTSPGGRGPHGRSRRLIVQPEPLECKAGFRMTPGLLGIQGPRGPLKPPERRRHSQSVPDPGLRTRRDRRPPASRTQPSPPARPRARPAHPQFVARTRAPHSTRPPPKRFEAAITPDRDRACRMHLSRFGPRPNPLHVRLPMPIGPRADHACARPPDRVHATRHSRDGRALRTSNTHFRSRRRVSIFVTVIELR